jgi:hypothetical protein
LDDGGGDTRSFGRHSSVQFEQLRAPRASDTSAEMGNFLLAVCRDRARRARVEVRPRVATHAHTHTHTHKKFFFRKEDANRPQESASRTALASRRE